MYNILFYIVIILYRLITFDIMPTYNYTDLPPIDLFNTIIKKLNGQITTTINLLSTDNKAHNYCYQTSDDLVKELLNIIYIPIKYDFFIKYIGSGIHIGSETTSFNPVIPDNMTVSPSDISVISKLSLDIHSNSNTIHNKKRINQEFSKDSTNAYMYMFQLAFGQLNQSEFSKDDIHSLTIQEELFKPTQTDKIHSVLPLNHSGFNKPINDTEQSVWKSAFLYKKFALNVSFTTITLLSKGTNRTISILEPTIRTVDYETLKIPTVDNTSIQKSNVNKGNLLPPIPKQNETVATPRRLTKIKNI